MKRAKWKGPFIKKKNITNKKFLVFHRSFEITSNFVGINCFVHSGNQLIKLVLTEEMIGHKLGEFVPTRKKFLFKKSKKK